MLIATEPELLAFLTSQGIPYQRIEHPPVYTCEQADLYRPKLPAVSTKNLFLRDKHGACYLVVTDCAKTLDLKQLGLLLHARKLHFASPEKLLNILGLTPGSVTVLALVNDSNRQVQLWIDSNIWGYENFLCHPLVNTSTLVLAKSSLEQIFRLTGHPVNLVEM